MTEFHELSVSPSTLDFFCSLLVSDREVYWFYFFLSGRILTLGDYSFFYFGCLVAFGCVFSLLLACDAR